jgi:hypothetical protein
MKSTDDHFWFLHYMVHPVFINALVTESWYNLHIFSGGGGGECHFVMPEGYNGKVV